MHQRALRLILAALLFTGAPLSSFAFVTVGVSITIAPPALPVYEQPPIPAVGYLWTPGYWAWDGNDYYWVPGTWVLAPAPGLLWTPGYWGWFDGAYAWHAGYWGRHIGFYGGVNYGFGYTGTGFVGGEWRDDHFFYNRAVVNLGTVHVTNVYERTVINNVTVNRVSYNGGNGGTIARPTQTELIAAREHHVTATPLQMQHEQIARGNPQLRAALNGGHPAIAATARATQFTGRAVVGARGAGAAVSAPLRTDRPPQAIQPGAAYGRAPQRTQSGAAYSRAPSTTQPGAAYGRAPQTTQPGAAYGRAPQVNEFHDNRSSGYRPPAAAGGAIPEARFERPAARPPESAPSRAPAPRGRPHEDERAR